jgi:hypothetical protein
MIGISVSIGKIGPEVSSNSLRNKKRRPTILKPGVSAPISAVATGGRQAGSDVLVAKSSNRGQAGVPALSIQL